ncbi:MAG: DNA repair protein RecO [Oscillospiraceae bacterium]|nr:DNA repair protein RecO [Oscillospiraceae bacterium]
MYINTTGLILRETAYKESSKILTVMTGGEGKLTVTAHGALRRNSKVAAVTQLLAFSEMTLYSRRDRWTLTEARSVEQFIGLRSDISLLALGAYFAELTEAVADEDSPNPELLPLCLNALYALSEGLKTPEFVKPAFELRLMAISGFAPLVESCFICGGGISGRAFLDIAGGTLSCAGCGGSGFGGVSLGIGAIEAMRHIIGVEAKKLFSYSLGPPSQRELADAAEGYLLAHLDRGFRTLDYYKGIQL